jgi:HlyD family secretion protein
VQAPQRLGPEPRRRPPSPQEAKGPKRTLWALRDGAPAAIAVVVGATDGRSTEIVSGELRPGERVLVDAVAGRR